MVNETCSCASHGTWKVSKASRYPFSIFYKIYSREVNRSSVLTIPLYLYQLPQTEF